MKEFEQHKKGYSPPALQRKYGLTYVQGYELAQDFKRLQEQLNEKGLWIVVLKSHLEECWEIIKLYAEHDYLTPEDCYMRDRLERYYRKAGLANIEDAKKLLEKWGVK